MNKVIFAAALVVAFSTGCGNEPEDTARQTPEPLSYTLYSEKVELFVEFRPLVVGTVSKFAAHVTLLGESFKPLTEGTVTVSLLVDGKGIRQTSPGPAVPGIYRLALKPTTAGSGKLIFDIQTKNFTDQLVIDKVKVYPDEQAAFADQPEETGGGDITYLKEQAWKVEFANARVKKQPFSHVIKTSGQILSAPGDEIVVTAKSKGLVRFSGSKTMPGTQVSSGTPLFILSGGDFAEGSIDAAYKGAKANYEKAKTDFERASELVKDKIISQKDFQETKLKFEHAQTAYQRISMNYSSEGQTVVAPIDGYLKNILVSEGQFVEAGTPLAGISKNKTLILQASVSQKYFSELPSVHSANFKTTESDEFISTEEVGGKLISYGKSVSAGFPFLTVTFEMNNPGNMIPGSVAEVYLKSFHVTDALVVPVSSLIEEQGSFFVYVQREGESFQKREVRLGAADGMNVQVLSGVEEGERVVTKGAFQIKLSTASGTLPAHGHEH